MPILRPMRPKKVIASHHSNKFILWLKTSRLHFLNLRINCLNLRFIYYLSNVFLCIKAHVKNSFISCHKDVCQRLLKNLLLCSLFCLDFFPKQTPPIWHYLFLFFNKVILLSKSFQTKTHCKIKYTYIQREGKIKLNVCICQHTPPVSCYRRQKKESF